jgi:iron complex outermembrane recepter protein
MQQVEVVRGPQVLFLGNSTTGGAISFTTRRPGNEVAVNADVSYEFNNNELVLNAGVDLPISSNAAIRVSGYHQDLNRGWLKSIVNGEEVSEPKFRNTGVRGVFDFDNGSGFELTLKAEYLDLRQLGNVLQPVTNLLGNPAIVETVFDRRRVVGRPAPFSGAPTDERNLEQQSYLARASVDIGEATLIATTGYVDYDYDQTIEADLTPQPIIDFRQFETYRQFSQELRLAGSLSDSFDYVIGGYFQRDALEADLIIDANIPPAGLTAGRHARLDQKSRTLSGFANFTWRPVEKLEISAGARYSHVRKTADQSATVVDVVTGVPNPSRDGPVYRSVFGVPHVFTGLKLSEGAFMPQASVQYSFTPDTMVFARFVRGEKAGGFDPLYADADPSKVSFKSERATSYEGGIKTALAGRSLTLALTGFYTKLDDLQVSTFNGSTNYVVGNAARARSQGFELETTWKPIDPLSLSGVLGYTDFKYLDFAGAGCTSQQNVAQPVGCSQDLSGKTGAFVSKWTGTANLKWTQPVGRHAIEFNGTYSYRSAYFPSASLDPLQRQKGFGLVDARVEFQSDDGWRIAVFGRNLTNKLFGEAGADVPGVRGATYLTTSRGRQLGISAALDF